MTLVDQQDETKKAKAAWLILQPKRGPMRKESKIYIQMRQKKETTRSRIMTLKTQRKKFLRNKREKLLMRHKNKNDMSCINNPRGFREPLSDAKYFHFDQTFN